MPDLCSIMDYLVGLTFKCLDDKQESFVRQVYLEFTILQTCFVCYPGRFGERYQDDFTKPPLPDAKVKSRTGENV